MQDAIIVDELVKSYDGKKLAVDHLSFNVKKGEVYGLLGRNGAGKSTTIKVLTTLIGYDSGVAEVLGLDVSRNGTEIRRRIGVVQQEEAFDFTTVENNFKLYGMMWELPREETKSRKEMLIELFDLDELRKKRMYDLSGGQKKRVQVAREFMHNMDVFFLDEPTVGLDPIMRRTILDYVKSQAKKGMTVLFTTQNLEEADYICDRIGIVNNGKKVAEGTSSDLKTKYGSLRTLKIGYTSEKGVKKEDITTGVENGNIAEVDITNNEILVVSDRIETIVGKILQNLSEMGIKTDKIMIDNPTLDDVFMKVVEK
ncbi:ABC transporter ATP-binding protein [Cuniculiplasma divulgatum]|uniref:DrugE1 family ABC transporter ATPase n=1 Tax=Cuniculiplasma divulgatum TaxID=1673428 RepID=A0A1N5TWG6_9ARCH|nr:ABC transporter ATP-binding protein [Cuniculiplasma divulgatum]OWP54631.1 MAG: multidrug ABC transporter ATP-binding protein [Cuniculiplasma sp. C_DKE]SIM52853.1 DrugE1 family ABC transporter ATPase [Cuniculiplasma divulgatum]